MIRYVFSSVLSNSQNRLNFYRFCNETNKFEQYEDALTEDIEKRKAGESVNQRMACFCVVTLTSIHPDLQFTVESQGDIPKERLPTF